ncbi:hypothetical protein FQN54_008835 [Arachnomyces sp. PD_36]|nr:hypothetical protein FQN54_008835 [Arachnomyces sp. PD_36]
MGQTSSTQLPNTSQNNMQHLPRSTRGSESGNGSNRGMGRDHPGNANLDRRNTVAGSTHLGYRNSQASNSNSISASMMSQHMNAVPSSEQRPTATTRELAEESPMTSTEEIRIRNATLARRQSTMSQLGTRILPNSVVRGLFSSGEETSAEGAALRNGHHTSRTLGRSETVQHSRRFSPFRSLSSRGIDRRRSIRGPYPLNRGDSTIMPETPPNPDRNSSSSRNSWRQHARLSRVRHSISTPLSQMFGQPSERPFTDNSPMPPPEQPERASLPPDPERVLPPLGDMDTGMDVEHSPHELDSVEQEMRPPRSISPASSRPSQVASGIRRLPSALRARSSRFLRREDRTPLSQVLQLAAAAIAAQLSGGAGPAMGNVQAVGADGLDGTLDSFIRSLNGSQSLQGQMARPDGETSAQAGDGSSPPVNFLRVFRFVNPDTSGSNSTPPARTSTDSESRESGTDRMDIDGPPEETTTTDGRIITLVVVGIRPVPANIRPRDENPDDASASAENPIPGSPVEPPRGLGNPGGLLRRADGRSRFSPHRHSMGSTGAFPSNYDSQRHHRSHTTTRGQPEAGASSGSRSSLHTGISDSPPGPFPPPSTPAEPGLSAQSSGTTSPNRRPSSSSGMPPHILPQLNEDPMLNSEAQPSVESTFNTARQRRRSDSEFARRRDLGSGAARRNGVVEADNAPSPTGRSWLIYVVGTNISENHPAFAAPSLFTDNPTYEDMILLSSLLGPAKPPVATQDDITSAGGLYRLVEYGGSLIAESLDNSEQIPIAENDRCLICLSDYEAAEEVRQLAKCHHIYHRECIDEWLTTGRNSCPVCRGQGVSGTPDANGDTNAQTQTLAP